jgi:hypothetical protein
VLVCLASEKDRPSFWLRQEPPLHLAASHGHVWEPLVSEIDRLPCWQRRGPLLHLAAAITPGAPTLHAARHASRRRRAWRTSPVGRGFKTLNPVVALGGGPSMCGVHHTRSLQGRLQRRGPCVIAEAAAAGGAAGAAGCYDVQTDDSTSCEQHLVWGQCSGAVNIHTPQFLKGQNPAHGCCVGTGCVLFCIPNRTNWCPSRRSTGRSKL